MKTKYIIWAVAAVVAIILLAYMMNLFQLRMEQAVGKFMTWLIIILVSFGGGWLTGRFGGHKRQDEPERN